MSFYSIYQIACVQNQINSKPQNPKTPKPQNPKTPLIEYIQMEDAKRQREDSAKSGLQAKIEQKTLDVVDELKDLANNIDNDQSLQKVDRRRNDLTKQIRRCEVRPCHVDCFVQTSTRWS